MVFKTGSSVLKAPQEPLPDFYDEYDTIYWAFATRPHIDTARIQEALVYSLDSLGVWDDAHALYIFAGDNAADGLINWIKPGTYNASTNNSPSFIRYQGYDFNGSDQYLTLFNPNGVIAQDDATIGVYVRENVSEAAAAVYAYDVSNNYFLLNPRNASNQASYRINQTLDGVKTLDDSNGAGFFMATRRGSTEIELYRGGTSLDAEADVSTGVPDTDITVGRAGGNYGTRQTAIVFICPGKTDAQATAINTIKERYMDRIGGGVQ